MKQEEILSGLERIENTMREKWDGYGIDILAAAREEIAALTRKLERCEAALRPFADWSRLEELHGSTIGHADIADDVAALLCVGELQVRVGTVADLRALQSVLSREPSDGEAT